MTHFTIRLTNVLFVYLFADPGSVDLEKVSNVIVDQSLKDQIFSREAGRISYTIVQVDKCATCTFLYRTLKSLHVAFFSMYKMLTFVL